MNIVLTNNPKLSELEIDRFGKVQVRTFDGTAQELIWAARDLISIDWELLADPLGGRLAHPNPFLSLLMRNSGCKRNAAASIDRLDRLLRLYWEQKDRFSSLTEEESRDLAEMDHALIHASLSQALGDKTR